jgi:ketosteroid isomerase-like protein
MNERSPVLRLWRALGRGDWAGMAAQFLPESSVTDVAAGEVVDAEEWVARQRVAGPAEVDVLRAVAQSNSVAVEVEVRREGAGRRCAAFYDLRDGRIARAAVYWV